MLVQHRHTRSLLALIVGLDMRQLRLGWCSLSARFTKLEFRVSTVHFLSANDEPSCHLSAVKQHFVAIAIHLECSSIVVKQRLAQHWSLHLSLALSVRTPRRSGEVNSCSGIRFGHTGGDGDWYWQSSVSTCKRLLLIFTQHTSFTRNGGDVARSGGESCTSGEDGGNVIVAKGLDPTCADKSQLIRAPSSGGLVALAV
eukprot:1727443-Amphidinium_carterae.1